MLKWYGKEVRRKILGHCDQNLERAAIVLQNKIKESIGRPNTAKPSNPSQPGEYPKKITGHLRRNIMREMVTPSLARVGTNVLYGKFLELGTVKMARRPWLTLGLKQAWSAMVKEMSRKI